MILVRSLPPLAVERLLLASAVGLGLLFFLPELPVLQRKNEIWLSFSLVFPEKVPWAGSRVTASWSGQEQVPCPWWGRDALAPSSPQLPAGCAHTSGVSWCSAK